MTPVRAIFGSVLAVVLFSATMHAAPKAPKPHPERLKHAIPQLLADAKVDHAYFGVSVTTLDGKPVYTLNDGRFFHPASNAKLFTTAAAMAVFAPQQSFTTEVHARGQRTLDGTLTGDLILIGNGDANFCAGHKLPYEAKPAPVDPANAVSPWHCLEELADQVTKSGLKIISGNIVGDDSHFTFEPYGTGWTQEDLLWGYGAPISALTIHDNQLKLTITPAAEGEPATVALEQAVAYYTLDVTITTSAAKTKPQIGIDRMPGSRKVRVFGSIPAGGRADVENLAIEDPAEYAAMAFKQALEARGVTVSGAAVAQHNQTLKAMAILDESRQPLGKFPAGPSIYGLGWSSRCSDCGKEREPMTETTVASVSSPPILEDIVLTNKISQNLHAELLLRQLGMFAGADASFGEGTRVVREFLVRSGVNPNDFVFYDGSGLSKDDMVTPRAVTTLLRYAARQSWFADWESSLPVGGVDGSLTARFPSLALKNHLFAKTGTLSEDRGLSGYVTCASGRTLVFSIFVNAHMPGTNDDRDVMDKIAAAIAAND